MVAGARSFSLPVARSVTTLKFDMWQAQDCANLNSLDDVHSANSAGAPVDIGRVEGDSKVDDCEPPVNPATSPTSHRQPCALTSCRLHC